jgi:hypothetical protein
VGSVDIPSERSACGAQSGARQAIKLGQHVVSENVDRKAREGCRIHNWRERENRCRNR